MTDAGRIDEALRAAGHAIDGVSVAQDGSVEIQWPASATLEQRQAGEAALAGVDRRPRRRRAALAILADLNALTAAQRLALFARWLAQAASDDPRLLRRLGHAIDGDEPDA